MMPVTGIGTAAAALWRHRWLVLAGLAALGLGVWFTVGRLVGPIVAVDRVVRSTLIQTVVASGHVETPFRVEIGSQITGTVAEVPVQEGQRVTNGQVLIRLDDRELAAALEQAEAVAAQAEARLRQIEELTLPAARAALREAEATQLNAQQNYDRASELARSGFATRVALDEARKNLDVARNQVRTAELQVAAVLPDGSDRMLAKTQLTEARAARAVAATRLAYATIAAPREGVLITRDVEQGSVVQPGRALLVLAPDGAMQLVLQIDERNLGKLAVGQAALASADAYADRRFAASLSYINPAVDIARAAVEVKLTVTDPPAYLRQDMTVSVDIEVARREGALLLPIRALRGARSPAPWVLAVRDGRAVQVPIRLGLQGSAQFQVLDGVMDGEAVIPATAEIAAGQRLRVAP